jgi:DNA-binding MarR family transcriptional regulator
MTDITSDVARTRRPGHAAEVRPATAASPQPAHDPLISFAELLYFAYRSFTNDPDAVLETYGFGRAHHRVLHFVHRNPGLKVAELLDILKITKQSLARVLKELIEKGFVAQRKGPADLRERRLYATAKGAKLAEKLSALQVRRIKTALADAGTDAEAAVRCFLTAMIAEPDRGWVADILLGRETAETVEDKGGPL